MYFILLLLILIELRSINHKLKHDAIKTSIKKESRQIQNKHYSYFYNLIIRFIICFFGDF